MKKKKINENVVQILLAKYNDHAQDLRHRSQLDISFLSGYITANFILGGFIYKNPINAYFHKIAFILSFTLCILLLIIRNYIRHKVVVKIIQNINIALRFNKAGIYYKNKINPDINKRTKYWLPIYITLIMFTLIGQIIIIFF